MLNNISRKGRRKRNERQGQRPDLKAKYCEKDSEGQTVNQKVNESSLSGLIKFRHSLEMVNLSQEHG